MCSRVTQPVLVVAASLAAVVVAAVVVAVDVVLANWVSSWR